MNLHFFTKFTKLIFLVGLFSFSQSKIENLPDSKVDYDGYLKLVIEVENIRSKRLINLEEFKKISTENDVIVLDARSADKFLNIHIKGAINLPFTDFAENSLQEKIPTKNTKILIYCNNNFDGDKINLVEKSAPLALNNQTFVNLFGYGYKNVYELADFIKLKDDLIEMEGKNIVKKAVKL